MSHEARIKEVAELAKGQAAYIEPGEYECAGPCTPDGCHGHQNGWAEICGSGPSGEVEIELGRLFEACEPEVVAALCDIAASARRHVRGKSGGDTLGSALARFDRAVQKRFDKDDNTT